MQGRNVRWTMLLMGNVLAWGVLAMSGQIGAAPKVTQPPFANPVEQSNEIIRELRDIKTLLQEQNTLLRASAVRKLDGPSAVPKNEPKR